MCGFLGFITSAHTTSPADLSKAVQALRHRGPDDEDFTTGQGWALGFRRLSILDLSEQGHQPMCTPDGQHRLVFNGEIYNFEELRQGLEQEGVWFRGHSDSEVLLHLLARQGTAALHRLNGMFAFAYLNLQRRTFLLVRDRLGVKPLYYFHSGSELLFASELKALLQWPDASRRVDERALVEYLALNYLPSEQCIMNGYRKLLPGHYLSGSLDNPAAATLARWWELSINPVAEKADWSIRQDEALHELLHDATRIRLRSDVPVGIFLSGGIDSGLVASLAAGQSERPPLALSVTFEEAEYDESDMARATAEKAGLDLRCIQHRPARLDDLDRIAQYYDEPFADASALPTYALCEAAAAHATVFLSGDGGDEAFAGYRRYIEAQQYEWLARMPDFAGNLLRRAARWGSPYSLHRYRLEKAALPEAGFAAAFDALPGDPLMQEVLHPRLHAHLHEAGNSLWRRWKGYKHDNLTARQQALDYDLYLPDDILVKMDRASMAHSIEVRSPFLDYRLVEWTARLSRTALLNKQEGKLPLRRLATRLLPPEVCKARKRGFGVPLDDWFRVPAGAAFVRERLLSPSALQREWWQAGAIEKMICLHVAGRRQLGSWFWKLLVLDAWARHYHDKH